MTVEELIAELKMYNPKADVNFSMRDVESDERIFYDVVKTCLYYPDDDPQVCITSYE